MDWNCYFKWYGFDVIVSEYCGCGYEYYFEDIYCIFEWFDFYEC